MTDDRRGDERRRGDRELARRLDRVDKIVAKMSRRTTIILSVVAVTTILLALANVYLLNENGKRADEIQAERAAAVRASCEETNHRHDSTIAKLHELVAAIPQRQRRLAAQRNQASTVALIEALVPRRDCRNVVAATVPSAAAASSPSVNPSP